MPDQLTEQSITHSTTRITAESFADQTSRIIASVSSVIDGKPDAVRSALTCLFAEGHLLIEDVPGVGKTVLARALAASVDATVRRIQFTPDLLPGDVTGVAVYDPVAREFEFKRGAVFANIVIADEINRASPKTQSALLEAMEEGQVTVDGASHRLPDPFLVVATQNPLEMEGTYPLPEAQRDRFMMRISMGYPDAAAETLMLRQRETANPLAEIVPVTDAATVHALIAWTRRVHVAESLEEYAVALAQATRQDPGLHLGASPRATLQLVRAAKVRAALDGREFVVPDDITDLVIPVFAHRLIAARGVHRAGTQPVEAALSQIIARVPVPFAGARR
ncbi:MoxR family ATPase [Microbacterium sp. ARD32]|uniref:AAA family ATPase n=1 Tax=Microbacterium sp. ARD32 TaxID=2962577 RepID=UPI002880C2DF|nr:MoxR family ATPase [Microbacterium sp. ARD32]MDT0158446.1 MoxR family ATPase [Microbacterium sp. ARD32]